MIECIRHVWKYWKCCCPNIKQKKLFKYYRQCSQSDLTTGISVTTVIANQSADPSTVLVAENIQPSYSTIFADGVTTLQMTSLSGPEKALDSMDACVQVDLNEHENPESVRLTESY